MNKGYFGDYGGLFIPETLSHALNELEKLYTEIKDDKDFNLQLTDIYKDYVGRPSPLYFAESITKHLNGPKIWFKREDLNVWGIDVNSKFETAPGIKNHDLLNNLRNVNE